MSILIINAKVPAKYAGFEFAVKHNAVDCLERVLAVPFEFSLEIDKDYAEPVVLLSGNTRRIGPVKEGKIRAAVRQGLAITRINCSIPR